MRYRLRIVPRLLPVIVCLAGAAGAGAAGAQDLDSLLGDLRRTKESEGRVLILEKIAKVPAETATPDEVVAALERGLEDDSMGVPATAATLLGKRKESEAALLALVEAAGEMEKTYQKSDEQLQKVLAKVPEVGDDDAVQQLERLGVLLEVKAEYLRELVAYTKAVSEALLGWRDDRCSEPLGELARLYLFSDDALPLVDGLFGLGTVPAIGEVVALFGELEEKLDERSKARRKLERERPGRKPKGWQGSKDAWKDRENSRIAGALHRFDEATAKLEEWRARFTSHVQEKAAAAGLPSQPESVDASAWRNWWGSARAGLPKSVKGEQDE
ncbi:hypothetical protein Poly30_38450 [Planctomycetes bacterium Poly30]|uniref:YfdX protein n=1 Tax=Saltatorellus ferox TaxID=2528018 RepID=A0A518EW58_9BACT|nr:hypothetical protein Poly30_38450 [Planctomycetes bacterium Poly30]